MKYRRHVAANAELPPTQPLPSQNRNRALKEHGADGSSLTAFRCSSSATLHQRTCDEFNLSDPAFGTLHRTAYCLCTMTFVVDPIIPWRGR
jgi:hypothetical protein